MKARFGALAFLGIAAMLAAVPVRAEPGDGRFGRRSGGSGSDAPNAERVERMSEFRRDEAPAARRMSPEERRQLRHDIRAAREDVYRRPQAQPPSPPFPPETPR